MSNLEEVRKILDKYDIHPKKSLGQNFLIDQNIINKIVNSAAIKKEDKVLEIGPGLGLITKELNKYSESVLAIEKDTLFVKILNEFGFENTKVVEADILEYIKENDISDFKIIANIPYYLTSNLIRNLLESENQPKEIYLVIQKEVAERICSKDGNILSISVKYYAEPKICFFISKNSFWPKPKIDSALIRIKPVKKYEEHDKFFFKVIKAGFSSPRKKLINNLAFGLKMGKEELEKVFGKLNINKDI
ncbi:MAG: 16S rRNA (adenine(1518)-N(6)/adenine(1519)-N(6))-dimethyltransferase RsmA, partial [Candidatus Pacebacteria bacterium]|nr:16S rRNA (adenine(1518)-N(6)/adenine(1519)-N(6))-dimethyltransferase RsmA [Candidatus Paceibacterota bacterium]